MVALGGSAGAIARYAVGSYIGNRMGSRFPYGTFVINISGSFVIGLVMTILAKHSQMSRSWLYLIPIGFIGAYTTFSTFEFETLRLIQDGQALSALMNAAASVVVGFAMVWIGMVAGRALP